MKSATDTRLGLALSGGGARGIIHMGVISALEDAGMRPAAISGTSMGAIVGVLYAAGMNPHEMLTLIKKRSWLKMFRLKASFSGFLENAYLRQVLSQNVPKTFEELKMPVYIGVTNLTKKRYDVFHTGPLHNAVLAASAIPVLFSPVHIHGERFVDGGVLNNIPAEPLREACNLVLGVDVNNIVFTEENENFRRIATEVFHLVVHNNSNSGLKICDAVIRPYLGSEFDMFDFSRADALFEIGYSEGKEWLSSGLKSGAHGRRHLQRAGGR